MKRYTREQVLEAIRQSRGIVSHVAKRLGCAWATARAYIEKWEETKRAFVDEQETLLDELESTLLDLALAGDLGAIKWWLSHKGRHRGWGKPEAAEAEPKPVRLVLDWNVVESRS